MVLLNEAHSAHGGIHLADAALPQNNFIISQATLVAANGIVHLAILDVHGNDDSYLHACLYFNAASTNATKSGWGCMAVDLYSGWNCEPTK